MNPVLWIRSCFSWCRYALLYSLYFYTWPFSVKCAVDLVLSTEVRIAGCVWAVTVTMRHPPSHLQFGCNHCPDTSCYTYVFSKKTKTKLRGFSPQANYTDRATAAWGLVVRVYGYRSRGPGFDSRRYKIFREVVGLERGPLSLVRITEELLEWKSSSSGSRKPRLTAVRIRCADHAKVDTFSV
jgi:hypothetical protein